MWPRPIQRSGCYTCTPVVSWHVSCLPLEETDDEEDGELEEPEFKKAVGRYESELQPQMLRSIPLEDLHVQHMYWLAYAPSNPFSLHLLFLLSLYFPLSPFLSLLPSLPLSPFFLLLSLPLSPLSSQLPMKTLTAVITAENVKWTEWRWSWGLL